jgi:hypothetical protein
MVIMSKLEMSIVGQWGEFSDQTDNNGFTDPEKEMNQLNAGRLSHFPEPIRFVSLNDTCELKPIN